LQKLPLRQKVALLRERSRPALAQIGVHLRQRL
jgi:hypothetical protein